ncbi:hypothetical protein BH11PLA2_BH11PLA2_28680 [soil metagenome]
MEILIADDEAIPRMVLERTLREWGHDVIAVSDGLKAVDILLNKNAPTMAILDWMMPEMEGPEICRRARTFGNPVPTYCILLTAKADLADVVIGLECGADDYVTKPFDRNELRSRILVGSRIVELQQGLADRVRELECAIAREKSLQGLLPICAWCKQIRNDGLYWQSVEKYLTETSDFRFTHCICPACYAHQCESAAG